MLMVPVVQHNQT